MDGYYVGPGALPVALPGLNDRQLALWTARGYLAFLWGMRFKRVEISEVDPDSEDPEDPVRVHTPAGRTFVSIEDFLRIIEYRVNCYLDAIGIEDMYQ